MINGKIGQRFLWKPKNGCWAFPYFEVIEILSNDNNFFKCKVLYSFVPKELAGNRFNIEAYWVVYDRTVDCYTLLSNQNKCEIL